MSWTSGIIQNESNIQFFDGSGSFTSDDISDLERILEDTNIEAFKALGTADITFVKDGSNQNTKLQFTAGGVTFQVDTKGNIYMKSKSGTVMKLEDIDAKGLSKGLDDNDLKVLSALMSNTTSVENLTHNPKHIRENSHMTRLEKAIARIAEILNNIFEEIMGVVNVMSTGDDIVGLKKLADKGIKVNGEDLADVLSNEKETLAYLDWLKENHPEAVVALTTDGTLKIDIGGEGTFDNFIHFGKDSQFSFNIGGDGTSCKVGEATANWDGYKDLLENPGSLLQIQTMLQQMKDSMAAIQAAGKTPGDVVSKSRQDFARNVAQ